MCLGLQGGVSLEQKWESVPGIRRGIVSDIISQKEPGEGRGQCIWGKNEKVFLG